MDNGRTERERIRRIAQLLNHGWIPDPLVTNDTPICDMCGLFIEDHDEESLAFETFMLRIQSWKDLAAELAEKMGQELPNALWKALYNAEVEQMIGKLQDFVNADGPLPDDREDRGSGSMVRRPTEE